MTVIATSRGLGERTYVSVETATPGAESYPPLVVGDPVALGIWYAQNPLATLFGLLGTGLAAGYFIWGRNRSGGMSGFAGTPEEHRTEWKKMMRAAESDGRNNDLIRAEQESIWFTLTPQEKKRHVAAQRAIYQGDYTEWEK